MIRPSNREHTVLQINWAVTIRHEFMVETIKTIGNNDTLALLNMPRAQKAAFWIDNRKMPATKLAFEIGMK